MTFVEDDHSKCTQFQAGVNVTGSGALEAGDEEMPAGVKVCVAAGVVDVRKGSPSSHASSCGSCVRRCWAHGDLLPDAGVPAIVAGRVSTSHDLTVVVDTVHR